MTTNDPEQVIIRHDRATGLELIVAVHSTALGPALGGMRLRPYPGGHREALDDALALASTMTLKAAAAGLDLGGGKAVVIDDGQMAPGSAARARRLEAAGAVIDELGGDYITAEDVGTSTEDMEAIARATRYVVGRDRGAGGGGDPSPVTAATVFTAIEIAVAQVAGGSGLDGVRVGLSGLGKVGSTLARSLAAAGAEVTAFDVDPARLAWARQEGIALAASAEALLREPVDVLAPCALGGLIDESAAEALRCRVVCGAANNPLAGHEVADLLAARGVLYVPDFIANCGGLIHVAGEWSGAGPDWIAARVAGAAEQLRRSLVLAGDRGITPLAAAERIAQERIAVGAVHAAA